MRTRKKIFYLENYKNSYEVKFWCLKSKFIFHMFINIYVAFHLLILQTNVVKPSHEILHAYIFTGLEQVFFFFEYINCISADE